MIQKGFKMAKTRVYIDGQAGTTGLQIFDRIGSREDLELMRIDEDKRHDNEERRKFLNAADIVFLCLPDDGAREAVSLIDNPDVRVIDASTAHRTNDDWTYGYPELSAEQRDAIAKYPFTCFSLTGYSGGGKKMIANYEAADKAQALYAPGIYGLTLHHKHIPEMQKVCALEKPPVFLPVVDDYYKGMATTIMLHNALLPGAPTAAQICQKLQEYYSGQHFVSVMPFGENASTIYAAELAGTNHLKIVVCGHEEQTSVTALFDNLGKGASGAAVQNMNIMLGIDEATGLE